MHLSNTLGQCITGMHLPIHNQNCTGIDQFICWAVGGSKKKQDVHVPAHNIGRKKQEEELKRKLGEIKEKRKIREKLKYSHLCLFVCVFVCPFVCLSICLSIFCEFVFPTLSVCPSSCLFICLCVCPFGVYCLFVCLVVCPFVCLCICLCVYV
jgi:hypothetical protein